MTQNSATVIVRLSPQQKTQLGVLAAGAGMSRWIRDRIDEAVRQDQAAVRLGAQEVMIEASRSRANPPPTSENEDLNERIDRALGWLEKQDG